ncbi:MAG: thiosulfate oxidation carrier protein SoxY [Betaproteobacteria bacterium]|nr:thiosulfate oxidation carrier protein SoxY [Betaproteobacteria bacterium]
MNQKRRETLKAGAGLLALLAAAGIISPGEAHAADWNKAAFEGKTMQDALKALGASGPANSTDIVIRAADIAENGAVVPVGVESKIPGTQSISILIDKNPSALAASFDIPAGTDPLITTRVKMGQTSDVYALVKANDKFFMAKKEIKVTLGGCGG